MSESAEKIVCTRCLALNRVPETRLPDSPVCGQCKSPLLPTQPVELTDGSFSKFVNQTTLPVVIDFWAPWCPPCRKMAPAFAAAARELSPGRILAKLNTDDYPQATEGLQITGIPCLIAFRNGSEVARMAGAQSCDQIVAWVDSI